MGRRAFVGQDLGQALDQGPRRLAGGPPFPFGVEEVEPGVQEPPFVGEDELLFLTFLPLRAEVLRRERTETLAVSGVEDAVDPTVTARCHRAPC